MTDKIRVIISNSQKEVKIPTGLRMLVRRCCNAVLRLEKFPYPAEISVTFVNNEQIQELNKQYRDKDMPTDVLSFPMGCPFRWAKTANTILTQRPTPKFLEIL